MGGLFSGYEIDVESELWFINTSSCCQVLEVSQDAQVAEHIYIYSLLHCKISGMTINIKCWYGRFVFLL